uniref:Uncharacterized protein n=1 Tax=Daphnia galeata TaxID=27404 RepID=A0A8J2WPA3_9CRUS|nr:unnamed protein product [Daphnia galeata]
MDAAQLAALHAASTRLAIAQATALNAATDATTAEAAATTTAAANPIVQADVTAANAHATQARVAAIMANNEQLTTGASVQGIKPKSTYQKQKSAKVTTAAAAATKADIPTKPTGATCDKCGLEIRPTGHYCPARNATCRKCNATGHFKAVCNAKAKMAAIFVNQVSSAKDDTVTISIKARGEPATEIRTLPDTGSTLDAIPPSVYHRQFHDVPLDVGIHAETATGNHIKSLGVMDCEPVHLTLREGAIPVQIRGYRNIAEPLIQMFKDELMSQVDQGLVRPVPPGAVTPFISGVVTMPKDSISGSVRITILSNSVAVTVSIAIEWSTDKEIASKFKDCEAFLKRQKWLPVGFCQVTSWKTKFPFYLELPGRFSKTTRGAELSVNNSSLMQETPVVDIDLEWGSWAGKVNAASSSQTESEESEDAEVRFFGIIRISGRCGDKPTVASFLEVFRLLTLYYTTKTVLRGANWRR